MVPDTGQQGSGVRNCYFRGETMEKTMKISAAGDILVMKRLLPGYEDLSPIRDFLMQGEVRVANLETTISDGSCFASAYSGGTWLTVGEECLVDIMEYGFNMLGLSNNHTMDYSYDGLLSTLTRLEKRGISYAGAGRNLYEASRPAILDTTAGQVAVIDICSTFENAARAGSQTERQIGRPGLNPLRFSEKYHITKEHAETLNEIANTTKINGLRDLHRQQGFVSPLPEGVIEFGGKMFEISSDGTEGRSSSANPIDVKRTMDTIKEALMTCEAVIVMVHSHEIKKDSDEEADYFLEEFAHACIDAGACAVIGGGTHQLKGIELYRECPIFYCLGNFIFENQYVRALPADYMEKYGLNIHTAASIGIAKRQEQSKHSLYEIPEVFRSVLPYFEIRDGKCVHLELLPIELGMKKHRAERNIPYIAEKETAEEITDYLNRVSAIYGTAWKYQEGRIVLDA